MVEDDDYATRLSIAMGAGGLEPPTDALRRLAKGIGVSYQAVAKLWSGGSKTFSAKNNSLAAAFLKVDADWLATGSGQRQTERTWPFGDAVTPADFFSLDAASVQAAIDVLNAAIKRQRQRLEVGRAFPAQDAPPVPQPAQHGSGPRRTSSSSGPAPNAAAKAGRQ